MDLSYRRVDKRLVPAEATRDEVPCRFWCLMEVEMFDDFLLFLLRRLWSFPPTSFDAILTPGIPCVSSSTNMAILYIWDLSCYTLLASHHAECCD